MNKLAINGGTPVRTKAFPPHFPGASVIGQEELKEITDVINEKSPFRHYGIGNPIKVATLEEEAANYIGRRFALAVSSGTAALMCAVVSLGLNPGDEVIIPSFCWYSDFTCLVNIGITPVFADIGDDLNLDPVDFEKKITDKTKAVIIVSYQGCPAKMDLLMKVATKYNIKVVEDIAQAFGASINGKKLGSFGDVVVSSFQTHKLITCGEGGIFMTDDEEYFERAVRFHDLGFVRPFFEKQITNKTLLEPSRAFAGEQLRMSELQGAMVLAQLRKLDNLILNNCRKSFNKIYMHFKDNKKISIRHIEGDCSNTFMIRFENKEQASWFNKALSAEGIPCGATSACCNLMEKYPIKNKAMVASSLPPFGVGYKAEDLDYNPQTCPNTNLIVEKYSAIAIGPLYTEDDINDIIQAMDKVLAEL